MVWKKVVPPRLRLRTTCDRPTLYFRARYFTVVNILLTKTQWLTCCNWISRRSKQVRGHFLVISSTWHRPETITFMAAACLSMALASCLRNEVRTFQVLLFPRSKTIGCSPTYHMQRSVGVRYCDHYIAVLLLTFLYIEDWLFFP